MTWNRGYQSYLYRIQQNLFHIPQPCPRNIFQTFLNFCFELTYLLSSVWKQLCFRHNLISDRLSIISSSAIQLFYNKSSGISTIGNTHYKKIEAWYLIKKQFSNFQGCQGSFSLRNYFVHLVNFRFALLTILARLSVGEP